MTQVNIKNSEKQSVTGGPSWHQTCCYMNYLRIKANSQVPAVVAVTKTEIVGYWLDGLGLTSGSVMFCKSFIFWDWYDFMMVVLTESDFNTPFGILHSLYLKLTYCLLYHNIFITIIADHQLIWYSSLLLPPPTEKYLGNIHQTGTNLVTSGQNRHHLQL